MPTKIATKRATKFYLIRILDPEKGSLWLGGKGLVPDKEQAFKFRKRLDAEIYRRHRKGILYEMEDGDYKTLREAA